MLDYFFSSISNLFKNPIFQLIGYLYVLHGLWFFEHVYTKLIG